MGTKKEEIKSLLKALKSNSNAEEVREIGKELLSNISPEELGIIEQEIIREGVSRKEMRKLCDVHLEVMKEGIRFDMDLPAGHMVHTLMEEHKLILDFVEKMKVAIVSLKKAKHYGDVKEKLGMLEHVAEHLVEADFHHKREEDVLFPAMEGKGVTEPPMIMREEHVDLRAHKVALLELARNHKQMPYKKFLADAEEHAAFIAEELPKHIYKEDNILYPIAIQVIPGKEWPKMKKECDKIGYCCFTPSK